MPEVPLDFDAVIVAGGRGSRLGGVVKADLQVGGERLLDRVLAAARHARQRVVVGLVDVPEGVRQVVEDPPGSGPAAGLVAGLDALDDPSAWTLVLACDLPGAEQAVPRLLEAAMAGGDADGHCLGSGDGTPQWLLGIHRSDALRRAAADYGDPRQRSVRGLLAPLRLAVIADAEGDGKDVDTWGDYEAWDKRWRMRMETEHEGWGRFVRQACEAVGVDPALVDISAVLDMTREVAHAGARPMAPVSAYLLGLAMGMDADADPERLRRVIEDVATAAPVPKKEKS
ncbi:NTP transferase domain-containing protein [Tessaracoccus antarcticus]|uniref:Molybdenum cofactor guanylyltransferase n=1 Tax=Tessaracoccus antarcticus TaxID=2479848 RepID=A0A3M0GAW6_9ACTN|nr:NTP transferase domain-containing protein [Tessaracoccus antarcticus]RMB62111.1 molybdenum cofactor guanylyltransferase [Tessaracoccus antarcticus]